MNMNEETFGMQGRHSRPKTHVGKGKEEYARYVRGPATHSVWLESSQVSRTKHADEK